VHGTRACGLDGDCWAGRYASRLTPDGSRQNHVPPTTHSILRSVPHHTD
jgi:hypothetical protein